MSIGVMQFGFRGKRSLLWVLLALALMLSSAYCFFGWMSAVGRISGWIGLPKYEAKSRDSKPRQGSAQHWQSRCHSSLHCYSPSARQRRTNSLAPTHQLP